MPELPEVEVITRGLEPHIINQTFQKITCSNKPLRIPVPTSALSTLITGNTVTKVARRAKYITISTDNDALLVIHLGMTGNVGIFPKKTKLAKHDHVRFLMQNGMELRYNDTRRFGSIQVFAARDENRKIFFDAMGPEPFSDDFSAAYLSKMAKNKAKPIKNFLMDNHVVVGLGNIYANEILFSAGILPTTAVAQIKPETWQGIIDITKTTLTQAIAAGGSTISDFVNSSGQKGYFQLSLKVYGHKDAPCQVCGGKIKKIALAGRATFFCTTCQK